MRKKVRTTKVNKLVTVVLKKDDISYADEAYQWNYGQILRIQGGNFPKAVEVHFSLEETSGTSVTRIGTTTDSVTEAPIPDSLLENNNCSQDYTIYAYIYLEDGTAGRTEYEIAIPVKARTKPEIPGTPEEPKLFRETVKAVNDAANRAEQAEQNAKASEVEAGKYATSASESAATAEKTKGDALREVGEKKREAIEAIQNQEEISVGKIVNHTDNEIQRIQNQTADSKAGLEQTITNADASKKELDESIQTAGDTKTALDKSTELAGTAKTELDTSTQKAGEAKTALDGSTNTAAEMQETLSGTVKQAGALDTSLGEKIETGTELKADLVASGEKAVQDIQTAGSEQLDKMQTVTEEFTADREQITKNKEDITGLSTKIYNSDIVEETSGTQIIADDSAEGKGLRNLKVYGWSKQESTTGAQLIDTDNISTQTVRGVTLTNNMDGTLTVTGMAEKSSVYLTIATILMKKGETYNLEGFYSLENGDVESYIESGNIFKRLYSNRGIITAVADESAQIRLKCRVGVATDFELKPFVYIGETALPFEPYTGGKSSPSPDYPQEIVSAGAGGEVGVTVCGRNLFDFKTFWESKAYTEDNYECRDIHLKPNTTYYFAMKNKKSSGTVGIWLLQSSYSYKINADGCIGLTTNYAIVKSFITDSTGIIKIGVVGMIDENYLKENLAISLVPINTYKPYREPQSLSISTPTGLPAIQVDTDGNYTDADGQQWIADYVDFVKGKYIQNIYKLPLKNLVKKWYTWGVNNLKGNITGFYAYLADAGYQKSKGMKVLTNICRYHRDVLGGANIGCNINNSNQYVGMSLPTDILEDTSTNAKAIESFVKIIEQTDAYVMYVLAEPIENDLTTEEIQAYQSLITYAPTTVLKNDADCHMELGYVADPKAYIDKKFSELSAAIVASSSEAE